MSSTAAPSVLSCLQVHLDGDVRYHTLHRSITSHSPRVCVFPLERSSGAPELPPSAAAARSRMTCQLDGEGSSQACIICGNAGSWIPGTCFPRHFYTIYAIFTRFYAIFTRFYMIFAIFTLFFARHLKLLCRPGSSLDESESELDFFTNE